MNSDPGPDEPTVDIHIVPYTDILWLVRPYETSLFLRDQIKMKTVLEDEELLCMAKSGDVSGHTIHSYSAPSLACAGNFVRCPYGSLDHVDG